MIEYRSKAMVMDGKNQVESKWDQIHDNSNITNFSFRVYEFRIFGEVYKYASEEFTKAYEMNILWGRLK